jgi:hypothetical protein
MIYSLFIRGKILTFIMDFMFMFGILIKGLEYNLEEYISKDLNIIMEKNIVIVEDFNN